MWWSLALLFSTTALALAAPCPRLADVEAELVRQRGERSRPTHEALSVSSDDAAITIRLDTAGTHIERVIPRRESCIESTRVVAAIVAAWESGDPPRTELDLPTVAPPTTSHPMTSRTSPRPAPMPSSRLSRRPVDVDLAAAFAAGWQGTDFAPGGLFDLRLTRRGHSLAGSIGAVVDGGRQENTFDGIGKWSRPSARLGAEYRVLVRRLSIDLRANVGLGAFVVRVPRIGVPLRQVLFDPSLGVGVRVGGALGHVRPFVGFEAIGWLVRQTLTPETFEKASYAPPRWDLLVVSGLAFTTGDF